MLPSTTQIGLGDPKCYTFTLSIGQSQMLPDDIMGLSQILQIIWCLKSQPKYNLTFLLHWVYSDGVPGSLLVVAHLTNFSLSNKKLTSNILKDSNN